MQFALPARAWFALIAVDLLAVVAFVVGTSADVPVLVFGGLALVAVSSMVGMVVSYRFRLRKSGRM